jgi:hypothetical protein
MRGLDAECGVMIDRRDRIHHNAISQTTEGLAGWTGSHGGSMFAVGGVNGRRRRVNLQPMGRRNFLGAFGITAGWLFVVS